MAANYGTASMIPFRFGKDWKAYHATDPSVQAPTYWERPHVVFQLQTNPTEHGWYELGAPSYSQTDVGDFSSSMAQVGYVSDPTIPRSNGGIDSIYTYDQSRHIIAQSPQVAWVYNNSWSTNAAAAGDGKDRTVRTGNASETKLVAITRPYGNSEEATHAFAIYQTGYVALLKGFNSDSASYTAQLLPSNLVPTAVSLTSQGEFALITCWDTQNLKGVLAVVAMGEMHTDSAAHYFNLPWTELYPGFRNSGEWSFAKYLGSIDLGMYAPTDVQAISDDYGWSGLSHLSGTTRPGAIPLSTSDQVLWKTFQAGGKNYSKFAHAGYAVVSSRYERKVVVVDLKPLFTKVESMMFGNFQTFVSQVVNGSGMAANQWPYAFSFDPSWMPKIVKSLTFKGEVTAMSAAVSKVDRALVATEDGNVHVLDMDGLQSGGAGTNTHEIGSIQLGSNITFIGHMRHFQSVTQLSDASVQYKFWFLSRGDKKISLVDFQSSWTSPKVVKVLTDSRLVDPIGLDDNSNHGIQLDLLNVADYGAKKIRAYRYGVVYWVTWLKGTTFGCGQVASTTNLNAFCDGTSGTELFEYGGDYSTPTGPWVINGQNVQ